MSANRLPRVIVPALIVASLLCGGRLLSAQSQPPSSAVAQITQRISESSLVTLRGNTHPLAQPRYDRGPAPASLPASRMLLVLKRSAQQDADLKTFLTDVQTPGSPNYHKFITPGQFGALYGPADSDVNVVSAWLQGHGFVVNRVNKARTAVEFSGSAAQLESAFHTEIHSYMVNGEQHYANASDPQIPAALAPVVAGVAHMNDFKPKAHAVQGPRGQFDPATKQFKPTLTAGSGSNQFLYVGPSDAATIYNSPITNLNKNFGGGTAYDGTGVTIGVAGDANIDVTGVNNYRSFFGLTSNTPTVVVDGDDPGIGDVYYSDTGEALLDVEIAGGIAPGAKVILYTSAGSSLDYGLDLAILRALDDNVVSILNVSFGSCEAAQGNSGNAFVFNNWEQAAAQGISVTVSTGDSGSAGCDNPNSENVAQYGLQVNSLASTPYNIAVGGTDFDVLLNSFSSYVGSTNRSPYEGTALRYIPEKPWNNSTSTNNSLSADTPYRDSSGNTNIVAAGGGASSCVQISNNGVCLGGYAKPSWQKVFDNGDRVRDLPDVSMFASNGFYGAVWAICATGQEGGSPVNDCQVGSNGSISSVTGFGGTSSAAPAFAGVLAIVSQKVGGRLGQANQVLYPLAKKTPSTFHDVSSGNISVPCVGGTAANCGSNGFLTGYDAKSGYDLASGLGSVDITALESGWSTVSFAQSTTTLTLNGSTSPLSITHGHSVSASVKVTGSGTPTGDVALVSSPAATPDNGAIASPLTLSSGSVSLNSLLLPGGSYNVVAHYEGDGTNAASSSSGIAVVVGPETSQLNISLAAYDATTGSAFSGGAIPYGSYFAMDTTPTGVGNTNDGGATGSVTFSGGGISGQTHTITSRGYAELLSTLLPPGTQTINATYSGDGSFNASAGSGTFTVIQGPTSTAASATLATIPSTSSDTITVQVTTDSIGALPTGTITLKSGSTTVGSGPVTGAVVSGGFFGVLDSATASINVAGSSLATGTNNITATYSGDANYASSTSSAVTVAVTRTSGNGLQFIPVTPCRVADTRNATGAFGGPELAGGSTREFDIPQSSCGIPSTAVAYSLNVTVVPTGSLNYLTIYPTGVAQPYVSTLNSDGRVKANAAITPAGTNGGVNVFVSDATHVILDIDGYFVPAGTASALAFYPVTPCRVADTRNSAGSLGGPFVSGNTSRSFPVLSSNCNLPSNAQAYSLNVTAIPHSTLNYLTAWPTGQSQPNVSTLNSLTGAIAANAAIVPAASNGDVSIFVSDDADVILDVNGYFAPASSSGLSLYTTTPCRVIDTRGGAGAFNGVLAVNVTASPCAPPSAAKAFVLNATVVPSGGLNYLTLWPDSQTQPYVSTLNANDAAITSNMAIVPTVNGSVDAFSSNPTNMILDISSYFAP